MPEHDRFYVIRRDPKDASEVVITVLHEVPADAVSLGSFDDPGAAIDFAQEQVQRLNTTGTVALYVDPPDDLVGAG
ncbi:MAG TPA: hypothetical protein VNV86_19875 [Candidatus Acidoferrum sp.]|nr:hypothetical protein [Candidatus Acidoferrum sp.]